MEIITLDFETFYGPGYTFHHMTTEDYVRDPRFDTMLVSVKFGKGYTKWFSGTVKQTGDWLRQFDIPNNALLCHNMSFDGLILQHHYGIVPKLYLDTRLMGQAMVKPWTGSASLKSCLEHENIGFTKGDEVANMFGRPRASLSKEELEKYASYCCNDTDSTSALFQAWKDDYPREELAVIDLTLRMYLEPQFELDLELLAEHLQEVIAKKEAALQRVTQPSRRSSYPPTSSSPKCWWPWLRATDENQPRHRTAYICLRQNRRGVERLRRGSWADDELVTALCNARTGIKSTLEETRTTRLLEMGRISQSLRVPLLYYAAHTGRYGGSEKINLQNLPQPHKSKIRFALRAPAGSVVLGADLSQIEARLAAWLAGQRSSLTLFGMAATFTRNLEADYTVARSRALISANDSWLKLLCSGYSTAWEQLNISAPAAPKRTSRLISRKRPRLSVSTEIRTRTSRTSGKR